MCCLCADDAHLASQAMPNFHVGHRLIVAPTPTGFAEIVSDDLPILHPVPGNRTHDNAGGFELRIRVRERQPTLDLHAQ